MPDVDEPTHLTVGGKSGTTLAMAALPAPTSIKPKLSRTDPLHTGTAHIHNIMADRMGFYEGSFTSSLCKAEATYFRFRIQDSTASSL